MTLQVTLDGRIGNGLSNTGDSLALLDGGGSVIDALSWGDDRTVFDPPVPSGLTGTPLQRFAQEDSDTAADWVPPTPATTAQGEQPSTDAGGLSASTLVPAITSTETTVAPTVVASAETPHYSQGVVLVSEVASGAGWIELYNPGSAPVDLRGWSLDDGTGSQPIELSELGSLPAHGFAVVDSLSLDLLQPGRNLVLRRPDGAVADEVLVGLAATGRSWSRYPVQGGPWTADTPLTKGAPNEAGPLSESETATATATPKANALDVAPLPVEPERTQPSFWVIVLLLTLSFALHQAGKRKRS